MKRRTPQQERRAAWQKEYAAARLQVLERDRDCQARSTLTQVRCDESLVVHHRHRRSQGGGNDLENLVALCTSHHTYIHDHPKEAKAHGFII